MFSYNNEFTDFTSSVAAYAIPIASSTLSVTYNTLQHLTADPAIQKIYLGTTAAICGLGCLAKSRIIDNTLAYFDEREVEPTDRTLAALSAITVTSGACLAIAGVSEFYNKVTNSNNMCETHPGFCHHNLGIPRSEMPQVEGEVADRFLSSMDQMGYNVTHLQLPAQDLMSTQNEINQEKVMGMVSAAKAGKFNPCSMEIIISTDGHVLDGHHRWATCNELKMPMSVAVVDAPIQKLLGLANNFEGVTHQGLDHFSK